MYECSPPLPSVKRVLRIFTLIFAFAGFVLQTHGQVISSDPGATATVRVSFWNIQWFPGRNPNAPFAAQQRQIAAVQRDIAQIGGDIIGMEEVRDFAKASVAVSPLRDFKVDVVANFPPRENQNVGQQVAIASRYPPMSAWYELWRSNGALTPPRGFAFAAYEIAPRKLLLVYAVHFKSNRGQIVEDVAIREEAMRQLIAHMRDMQGAYGKLGSLTFVVGGDFNTAPDDGRFAKEKTVRALTENGFSWCWQGIPLANRITLPGDQLYPPACFDHIFVRNGKIISARVIQTSAASSDHRAITAEVSF